MASVHQSQPAARPGTSPIKFTQVDLRRHSSANPSGASPAASRNGSTTLPSSQPAWMSSIQERDRQNSTPEAHSSGGLKGLFGRRKSSADRSKKEEKVVITSKHAAQVMNNLKVDPRGARKLPSVPGVPTQGTVTTTHTTAEEQEMRHPHSGPPALRHAANLPMLTRIVSGDEIDDEVEHEQARARWDEKKEPEVEKVVEHHGEEESQEQAEVGGVEDLRHRRRSLLDVEVKGGEGAKPARRRSMFGVYRRDSNGNWKK